MLTFELLTDESPKWNETIAYAEDCSWDAGKLLARLMRKNEFTSYERVITANSDERIVGFCTFSRKDECPEKYSFEGFVGFVFVDEKYRGKRISEKMINFAGEYAAKNGFEKIYIMSDHKGLYEKFGFEKIGVFDTIYGWKDQLLVRASVV